MKWINYLIPTMNIWKVTTFCFVSFELTVLALILFENFQDSGSNWLFWSNECLIDFFTIHPNHGKIEGNTHIASPVGGCWHICKLKSKPITYSTLSSCASALTSVNLLCFTKLTEFSCHFTKLHQQQWRWQQQKQKQRKKNFGTTKTEFQKWFMFYNFHISTLSQTEC